MILWAALIFQEHNIFFNGEEYLGLDYLEIYHDILKVCVNELTPRNELHTT